MILSPGILRWISCRIPLSLLNHSSWSTAGTYLLDSCLRYFKVYLYFFYSYCFSFNTRSGRVASTTPSGRGGGGCRPPLRSQLPLELARRNLEGRWGPRGTLLCVNFMTLGQYLQGQMRSNVVKSAILATFLRLHADNSKSYRPIFLFSFTVRKDKHL